jgi:hypothetical protein
MTDKKIYKNHGTFVSAEIIKRGNSPYLNISYVSTAGPLEGKTLSVGNFISTINDDTKNTVKSLKEGESVTLEVEKSGKFSSLIGVETGHTSTAPTKSKSSFNEAGVKVGAVLHDAVAVACSRGTTEVTDIETIARELLTLSTTLESEIKNGSISSKVDAGTSNSTTSVGKSKKVAEASASNDNSTEFDELVGLDL